MALSSFYIPLGLVQSLLYNKHLLNYLVMFTLLNMLIEVLKSTAPPYSSSFSKRLLEIFAVVKYIKYIIYHF